MMISILRMPFLLFFEYVKFCNTNASGENSKAYIDALYAKLKELCDVLGIIVEKEAEILDADIEKLIEAASGCKKREKTLPVRMKFVMNWPQWELF